MHARFGGTGEPPLAPTIATATSSTRAVDGRDASGAGDCGGGGGADAAAGGGAVEGRDASAGAGADAFAVGAPSSPSSAEPTNLRAHDQSCAVHGESGFDGSESRELAAACDGEMRAVYNTVLLAHLTAVALAAVCAIF